MEENPDRGICILGLDSGGAGTHTQLCLVKQITSRLAADLGLDERDLRPADYFDLMGGVGFGGLLAFTLGFLRMTVTQATETIKKIASALFPDSPNVKINPEMNKKSLKQAIKDMLQANHISLDTKMYEKGRSQTRCKVALYAATAADVGHAKIFRTYSHRGSGLNPTIFDALCATIAIPSLFSPIKIGPSMREQSFVGGPLGASNPTRELLKEASTVFGDDQRVAQIISIGTGVYHALSFDPTDATAVASQSLNSLLTDCEMVASELSTRLFHIDAYVRLNVDRGVEGLSMDSWTGFNRIEQAVASYVATAAVTRALEESTRYLQNRVGTASLGQINQSSIITAPIKAMPPVSPYFVVRQKQFASMIHHLTDTPSSTQKVFAITGMGGCGKTQMVSYFLREKGSRYEATVYADSSSLSALKADLQAWSRSHGSGHEQDVWEDALSMLAGGLYEGRWILVLDNADNPTLDLAPFIPKCYHGTVVITSRNRNMGDLANTYHLELGEMEVDEAISALLRAARRNLPLSSEEMTAARELIKMLGYLAVALVQAGTYCYQLSSSVGQPFSFSQYFSLFLSQRAELMKRTELSLDNYQLGAYAAFDLSYKAISQIAKEFLHFSASFYHSNVALPMFAAAAGYGFADPGHCLLVRRSETHSAIVAALGTLLCVDGKWSEIRAHQIIHTLRSFSLISASSVASMVFLHLHPLVHAWARDMVPSPDERFRQMALQVLTACSTEAGFKLYRHLVPHIRSVLDGVPNEEDYIVDKYAAALVLDDQGHYDEAEELLINILQSLKQIDEGENEAVTYATHVLAKTYLAHGKWAEAKRLQSEALEQWEAILPEGHPSIIRAKGNLAEIYSAQGHHKDAEILKREVWEQRQQSLGKGNTDTILAAANLAATYGAQGRYKEAEELEVDVLVQHRKILGDDDPDTILAASNLAITYQQQGRYGEAENLQLTVLEQQRRLLGKDHPNTIMTAANLATTYSFEGLHKKAEELEVEILAQRIRLLGKDHPSAIMSAGNLASTYLCLGRCNEAEELTLQVLEQRRRMFGHDHPDTIRILANLASIYSTQGSYEKAEELMMEGLESQRKVLGEEHPSTLLTLSNLAGSYACQKEWGKAEPLIIEAVNISLDVLGQEHPVTQRRIRFLRLVLTELGKPEDAKDVESLLH